jgi:hypothetical protein
MRLRIELKALRGAVCGGSDKVEQGKADHMISALNVDLPILPPVGRIRLADLGPGTEKARIRVSRIDAAKCGNAISHRSFNRGSIRDIAHRQGTFGLRVGLAHQ